MRLVKLLSKGEGIRTLLWTFIKSFQVTSHPFDYPLPPPYLSACCFTTLRTVSPSVPHPPATYIFSFLSFLGSQFPTCLGFTDFSLLYLMLCPHLGYTGSHHMSTWGMDYMSHQSRLEGAVHSGDYSSLPGPEYLSSSPPHRPCPMLLFSSQ